MTDDSVNENPGHVHHDERFAILPEWMIDHPNLDGHDLHTFAILTRYAGSGEVYPSLTTQSERARRSIDSVRRSHRRLESAGALRIEKRFNSQGRQTSNLYHLATSAGPLDPGTGARGRVAPVPGGRVAPVLPHEGEKKEREKTNARTKFAAKELETEFDLVWRDYPRKIAKGKARRAYVARRREGQSSGELHTAVRNYAAARDGQDAKFTLHGSTFFGPDENWRDYLTADAGPAVPIHLQPQPDMTVGQEAIHDD